MMENKLPKGWDTITLKELCNMVYGKGLLTKFLTDEGYPVYGANGIIGKYTSYIYKEPQVIISCRGAACGVIHKTVPFSYITSNSIVLALKSTDINLEYFKKSIMSVEKSKIITGSAQPQITIENLNELEIPIAPFSEQNRIVSKLDAVMQKVESNKERLEKIPKILKRFRKSVLIDAYTGKLSKDWREKNTSKLSPKKSINAVISTSIHRKRSKIINENFINLDIPTTWITTNIDCISDFIVDCSHSTPKWSSTGKICLRTTNFLPNKLNMFENKFVTESTFLERIARLKPEKGDILYSREGGILGIACILDLDDDVCLGQRMMLFRLNSKIDNKFICYYLNSPIILEHVNNLIGGSAAPHINVGDIKEYPIPFPSFEEQVEIVKSIEKLFAFADKLEARYMKAKTLLDKLPQSILAKAFRGELVPQDPNDEPASVLLERIRKEKEGEKKREKFKR